MNTVFTTVFQLTIVNTPKYCNIHYIIVNAKVYYSNFSCKSMLLSMFVFIYIKIHKWLLNVQTPC